MDDKIVIAGYRCDAHLGVFICSHVAAGARVRSFFHEPDGDFVFTCGGADGHDNCKIAGLCHLIDHHPEITSLPDVKPGEWAGRGEGYSGWIIGTLDQDV